MMEQAMPDRIAKLRATLRELEEELAGIETLDDQTRAELALAREEIEAALEVHGSEASASESGSAAADAPEVPTTAVDRLRAATRDFEAEHPNLTAIVQRTIDGLSQLGI
jgi:hypothetical protein